MECSSEAGLAYLVLKRRATVTVIIFTGAYLLFNTPLIVNLILWVITQRYFSWPGPFYSTNTFMYMYFWNLSDILFTGLNASLNPAIYFLRFPNFQTWAKDTLKGVYLRVLRRKRLRRNKVSAISNALKSARSVMTAAPIVASPRTRETLGNILQRETVTDLPVYLRRQDTVTFSLAPASSSSVAMRTIKSEECLSTNTDSTTQDSKVAFSAGHG